MNMILSIFTIVESLCAITTTVLAVMTAIVSARSATCVSRIQILTAKEGSAWAYYQAKSIKQNLAELQRSTFEALAVGAANAEQKAVLESKIKAVLQEVERYDAEKTQIRKEAEDTGAQNKKLARKGNFFSASVVFFQIAIMLSSVSALIKRKELWIIGIIFGVVAILLLTQGLILKPLLF